jgi:hypothetical protein
VPDSGWHSFQLGARRVRKALPRGDNAATKPCPVDTEVISKDGSLGDEEVERASIATRFCIS